MTAEPSPERPLEATGPPLRLAFVTSHPIQYQAPLFRALAQRPEVDLTVFFCSDHGLKESRDPGFGVSFKWDVPLLEGYRSEFLPNRSPRAGNAFWGQINPGLFGRIRRGGFDAVLVHGYAFASCWIAFAAALASRSRLMLRTEVNLLEPRPFWKRVLKQSLLRPAFKIFDRCLPIGSLNYEYYRHYGVSPLRMVYAPYAVDNRFFSEKVLRAPEKRAELRAQLGLPKEGPVVLLCARLLSNKHPMDLLRALEATESTPPIHALVVGDGALRGECESFAKARLGKRVVFAGFQNQSQLPSFYAAADLLVLPSEQEPWGLVVNEAMASGLAVIASSSVGAAADLVWHGKTGFVYPAGRPEQLAKYLDLSFRPETLRRFQEAGRRRISAWSLEQTVQGILRATGSSTPFRAEPRE
jgi:glycosyltransferase involved in cell wall biosynthesis